MKLELITASVLISLTAFALPAAAKPSAMKVPAGGDALASINIDVPAKKFVLKNGLTLIVHEDKSTPLVAVNIWYHVGSKNEPKGKSGFAHLFEHLMFNGSEHFNDDFFKATQKLGASQQNGTTDVDRTNFYQTVPKGALNSILWLESDRMGHLLGAIDQARLDEQRAVVKNEKREGENDPASVAQDLFITGTTPQGHPYDHSIIGSMDDLDAATLEDVKQWFHQFYGPSNAVLVLAGDISPEEALAKVDKYFGWIPPGEPVARSKSNIVRRSGAVRETASYRAAQPQIIRIWNMSDFSSADTDYLQLLALTLSGSRTSPLVKRLVLDDKLATAVEADVYNREIGGQFSISVAVKPEVNLRRVEEIIDEELAKIFANGPPLSELIKARTLTIAGLVRRYENLGSRAELLAESETFLGSPDAWKIGWRRYRSAKPSDLQAAAKRWLTDGDYILHLVPFGELSGSGSDVDRTTMPAPVEIALPTLPAVERGELSNGLKLMVASRPGTALVNMTMLLNTGYSADWKRMPAGTGTIALDLLNDATLARSGDELSNQIAAIGASIGSGGGGESSQVSLSALKSTLDEAIAIYADVILNPAYTDADIERVKASALVGLAAVKRDGAQAATRLSSSLIYGEDSPYGRLQHESDINAIDAAGLRMFHDRWFKPNNATLVVSGDTSLAEIRPILEKAFAKWVPGAVPERITPITQNVQKPLVYLIDKPGAPQSTISAIVMAPRRVDGDNPARAVFTAIMGAGFTSRMNMKLREEKGWAYGAAAGLSGGRGTRVYSAQASVQLDKTADAIREIMGLLRGVTTTQRITEKEVAEAKANITFSLANQWSSAEGVAISLIDQLSFELPDDYYVNYPQGVADVTVATASAEGDAILRDKPLTWIVAGDLAKIEAGIRALDVGQVQVINSDGKVLR